MRVLKWLADLIYPPKCILCQKLLQRSETDLCTHCRCQTQQLERPLHRGEFFRHCYAVYYYENDVAESLRRFKFSNRPNYAGPYGALLGMKLLSSGEEFDLITWVPVSRKRLRRRGYDQSRLLAESVARALGLEAICTLRKIRDNKVQSRQKGKDARKANVFGVYAPVSAERFEGKRVLLIDDIITTGATLSECSRVLRTAGAADVIAAAIAATRKSKSNSR